MDRWFEQIEQVLSTTLGIPPDLVDKVAVTLSVLVILLVVRWVLHLVLIRRLDDVDRRYIAVKSLNYVVGITVVVALLRIWLGGLTGLAASIGIISAGLAIALHDPLTNLVGWIFLTVRRPFTVGDRIQIGEHAGDVIDLRLFAFSLVEIGNWVDADQSTGRILHIPNGRVFRETLANFTQGFNFIWDEIPVTITFESDWRTAKQILTEVADRHSALTSQEATRQLRAAANRFLIRYEHLTPIVWTSVADIGVTLTIRFLTEPRKRRSSEQAIWEDILERFAGRDDIDFAYPTQRFYDNVSEGKVGARAKPGQPTGPPSSD
jgi:small-conductance mechanosensitive channel